MTGCASAPQKPLAPLPRLVELTATRCPPADAVAVAELRRLTKTPSPDMTAGLSRDAVRGWIDKLEASERRKSAAGLGIAEAFERCRTGATIPSS